MEGNNLIKRVQKGDKDAFRLLVEKYQGNIFSYAYRMTGSKEEAKDLAQEVFIRVYTNLSGFNMNSKFLSWALRITYNLCVDHLRKKRPVQVAIDDDFEDVYTGDGPEERLLIKEKSLRVKKAISELKPEQRAVVVLAHYHELSYKEIAGVLGITESLVRNRLYTARKTLSNLLRDERSDIDEADKAFNR
jgi:RNA polymerase sigma-70 factor (ECF subfamily)